MSFCAHEAVEQALNVPILLNKIQVKMSIYTLDRATKHSPDIKYFMVFVRSLLCSLGSLCIYLTKKERKEKKTVTL